ncbi:aminotransferase class I/II-fold pyridoxal phosphate-dependent enzyme [Chamaesiphon sp. GL140_3_metabinner_50]|uniref:aminotransferase class I/II-fold pyridoxal phosphate-dependent enzyme n=1 Tax=Chamaesiphon sp. GL140_3_metabinner_50 TaxID=2970812 RepID=UPI0025D2F067|nr:aminotransferase class I/II-fold pyridoxal phosphate-dependent enzyme [Chamaesiphon sp. GL140_3_metabinner_50]
MNRSNQCQTPIIDALEAWVSTNHAAFYTPGHKRGVGMNSSLVDRWGADVLKWDLPELPGLDNLHAPTGIIAAAQALAAETFGAQQTWFLVNGSTAGVIAAILATCGMGDKIILPRNIHSSAIAGVIHAGAVPIFIEPEYDRELDLAHSITPAAVKFALEQHPDTKAVMVVYPTYYGACGDLAAIAEIVHSYQIPLLVDEAHGAHLGFHADLPPAALSVGADLAVQSTHKLLGALTQSAMLHVNSPRIDIERVSRALRLLQTTSPSYLLLASLDAARQQMALHGEELMAKTIELARIARERIERIDGLSTLKLDAPTPGWKYLDPTRLTVTVTGLNLTGFEADEILTESARLPQHPGFSIVAELPSVRHLTFIISLGNTLADIDRLVAGFTELASNYNRYRQLNLTSIEPPTNIITQMAITPRQADRSHHISVPFDRAVGKISAESICPYPPGIPVLIPGEIITTVALTYLQKIIDLGGEIAGCSDPTLATLRVVVE